jgi:hypothetical protein
MWLPIDVGMIVKLQAVADATSVVLQRKWFGIVSGGGRMFLPSSYVVAAFTLAKVDEAQQRADVAATNTRPEPVDVSDVGAAVS